MYLGLGTAFLGNKISVSQMLLLLLSLHISLHLTHTDRETETNKTVTHNTKIPGTQPPQ